MLRVLVFGTGDYLEKILSRIEECYEIRGFLDNSDKKQNTYIEGKQKYLIMPPDSVKKIEFDKVVIASINYAAEMFSHLLVLGVREHNIIVDFVSTIKTVFIFDFLKMQVDSFYKVNRLDIAVKYLAIEQYYGKNDYGYTLYKKMQKNRLGINDTESEIALNQFIKLIKSFEENGWQRDSYIVCDEKLRIMDGAHRVAICLYLNNPFIRVRIIQGEFNCDYGEEWFWKRKFDISDIKKINSQYNDFFQEEKDIITAILWPPVSDFFEKITGELSELVEINEVVDKEFLDFSEFQSMVQAIYSVDDIEEWKIQKKLDYMHNYSLKIRILKFSLPSPLYRLKSSTRLPLSIIVERIKRIIRERFMEYINPYYYDIIIHIADNYYQSTIVNKILTLNLNIISLFEMIKENNYALTKMNVPYMTKNFPNSFPIHKDADIICEIKDLKRIAEKIVLFCREYAKKYHLYIKIILEDTGQHYRIRLEYLDYLIYQFDLSSRIENLTKQFVTDAIRDKCYADGYYQIADKYEVIIRLNEIIQHPQKKHHKEYLKNVRINKEYVGKYMLCDRMEINKAIDMITI